MYKMKEEYKTSIDFIDEQHALNILEFLNTWLTRHILHNDKLIGK